MMNTNKQGRSCHVQIWLMTIFINCNQVIFLHKNTDNASELVTVDTKKQATIFCMFNFLAINHPVLIALLKRLLTDLALDKLSLVLKTVFKSSSSLDLPLQA